MSSPLAEAVAKIARHCWRGAHWERRGKHPSCIHAPLAMSMLERHVEDGPRVGLAPIVPGTSTTRIAVLDMDSHKGEVPWERMIDEARALVQWLEARELRPIPFRSTGGSGIHLIMLWDEEQDAYSVRQLLVEALAACGLKNGAKGVVNGQVEVFPKQDEVEADGFGSMFILPLGGESLPLDPYTFKLLPHDYAENIGEWPRSQPVPARERPKVELPPPADAPELADLRAALAKIPNDAEHSIEYDAWRNIVFGIHNATGGSDEGLALAHEFSARSPKYDAAFLDERVWPYIRDREKSITAATIFDMARSADPADDVAMFDELPGAAEPGSDAATPDAATAPVPFAVVPDEEYARRPAPEWIIKGILPRADLVVLYGESTAGKSFIALDMAAAIARGLDWCGRKTKRASVVYIAAEGAGGVRNRLLAYCKARDVPAIGLGIIAATPNLLEKKNVLTLAKALKSYGPVDLLIVDTLAQATPGANENSGEDMGKALAHCRLLTRATGATVLLIHHAGKDIERGARGWSGIKAAVDAELEVRRIEQARTFIASKVKDGEDGAAFPFRLQVIEVGRDEDGEPITSCAVEFVERAPAKTERRIKDPLQQRVWQAVNDLLDLGGEEVPIEAVIDLVAPQLIYDPLKRDTRREAVVRALRGLADERRVSVQDDTVKVLV